MTKKSILSFATFALLLSGGAAMASPRGATVRDQRGGVSVRFGAPSSSVRGSFYGGRTMPMPMSQRSHGAGSFGAGSYGAGSHGAGSFGVIRVGTDNRFHFSGGITRPYVRPMVQQQYYSYQVRPQPLVEQYDRINGYIWVPGQWQWNGSQWIWTAGYYTVDPAYATVPGGYGY